MDCESAGLNIRGQGVLNPSLGIETFRGGHGAPVAGLPGYGTPIPSPSPSPAYVSSSPAPAYVSSSPQPPYSPDYVDSPYYGEDEPGYSYPVPAHPLALPTRVPSISGITPSSHADSGHIADAANGANYVVPSGISSTYRPDIIQTPAPIPAYGVSSTYGTPLAPVTPLPSYGTPLAPVTPIPRYYNFPYRYICGCNQLPEVSIISMTAYILYVMDMVCTFEFNSCQIISICTNHTNFF